MYERGWFRAWRRVAGVRALVMVAVLSIVVGAFPVQRAAAAGNGVLTVSVTIVDTNGVPITEVDPAVSTAYSVNVAYSCSVANCDSTSIAVAPTALDVYYGTHRRESSYTVTPPQGVTPTTTGNLTTGLTINLGTVTVGTAASLRVNYTVGGNASFFDDGSLVQPQVTIDSPTATGPKTGTASAVWRITVPEPTVAFSAPVRTRTDADVTFNLGLSNSGCVRRVNGVWAAIPSMLCAGAYTASVRIPDNAEYISGGDSYDPGTRTVTWSASGDTNAVAHGYGAGAVPIAIRFPSESYGTTPPSCIVDEPFAVDYTVTYLDGTEKTASTTAAIQVQNCTPFAKGTINKAFTVAGTTSAVTTVAVPTAPGTTKGVAWQVTASNQSNVEGIATIVDDTLDQDDLAVTGVQVLAGGPASVTYTLEDNTTATVTVNQGATFTAPAGHHITKVTAVSSELIGPNTLPTQAALTSFTVRFQAQLPAEATLGTRTNTATGTISYPNYPALSPVPLQATRTITITGAAPAGANASNLTALLGSPPVTPVAGTEVPWTARGQYTNVPVGSLIRPQYVFAAPVGWNIVPNSASMEAGAPAGITFTYRTATIGGVSRQVVIANWPDVVGQVGTVTLPLMTVRTVPTTAATPGTNNQTASLFVGDADNGDFATYLTAKYTDAGDMDADGQTTESFAQRNTAVSLAPTSAVGALKEICKPDPTAADGCDWIADSSVRVGVPPSASSIKYRLTVQNLGNGTLNNIVGYDVLPYVGDTGTTTATASTPRGSTVKEQLVSVSDVSAGLTLTYSTSTNPPRPEVYSGSTSGTFTSTVAGASTIRMAVASLPAGQSRSFVYVAGLVGGAADQVACNSVAITAATLTAIEPAAVCATTQEADFSITSDDRLPLQEGRRGLVPFVVNQGGGSQVASGTVTIDVPADVTLGNLSLTPDWRCEAPTSAGPVTVTCVPVKPDTTRRQLAINAPETIRLEVTPGVGSAGTNVCFDAVVEGLINDPVLANNSATSCSDVVAADTGLAITKDDGTAIVAPGAQTTYTIEVANVLTAETVAGAVVTDTLPANTTFVNAAPAPTSTAGGTLTWNLADLAPAGVPGPGGDEATGGAGSTQTITVTVAVSATATGALVNTASVTADDPAGGDDLAATDSDTDTVQSAAITLTKTATPMGVNAVGDSVTYTFVVTNTGNVPLSGIVIDDPLPGLSAIDCGGTTTLAAGADVECTATYAATAGDFASGAIVNTATVSGQPAVGDAVDAEATATVAASAAPRLDLTKDTDPTDAEITAAGDEIQFTFTVSNSGNVAVSNLTVADQLPGTAPVSCVATSLAPGASTTCSTSYPATQADVDAGQVVNTATATATAANGAPVTSAPASKTVTAVRAPAMTLAKSATETSFTAAGTVLHFRLVVANTGNVTLTGVAVDDPLAGTVTCPSTTLPAGQQMTCTATYTATQDDVNAGGVTNVATATADGSVTAGPADVSVPANADPAIAIVKTVGDTQLVSAGQELEYTFAVTNTGNLTLTSVHVVDPFPGLVMGGCGVTTLAPGESTNCTATYTVTQQNIDEADQLTNSATAVGTPPAGPDVVSLPDSASVPPVVAPQLTVDKTSGTAAFDAAGTAITFDFAVTNSGNVTIDGLTINDPLPGVGAATCDDADGVLAPGASTVCHAAYTTTQADVDNGGVTNTATASGTSPSGAPVVSNVDTLVIDAAQSPAATLVKGGAADVGDVDTVGEQVTYTFDVRNTGNVTLTNVTVDDTMTGLSAVSCPTNVLIPDAQVRCTATYAVTQADLDAGTIHNEAEVTATGLDPVPDEFDLDVAQNGAVTIVKTALTTTFDGPDQALEYEFLVTNTGNVGLSQIVVTDPLLGPAGVTCPVAALAPAASTTCTGTYTTTQTDVDRGVVENTVTVEATASGGAVVTASDDASVNAEQNAAIELTKTADAVDGQFDGAGQLITYTLTVTNTGNVTLSDVAVVEELDGASLPADCNVAELAPAADVTCTVTYTTTQQDVDAGGFTNTATVEADGPGGAVSDAASAPLVAIQTPGATFTKSAVTGGFDAAGDVLTFTLTVTNTGNVTLTSIEVSDALPGVVVDCPTDVLAPQDEPLVCTATYTVTQQDVDAGSVTNDAQLVAAVPGGDQLELDATATVIGTQTASIALVKSAQEQSFAAAGQTIHYRFLVTNTGNVTLTDLTVIDPLAGLSAIACPVAVLAPGASTTCTASYRTTQANVDAGRVVNTATARAVAPSAPAPTGPAAQAVVTVSAQSTVTVPAVQAPGFQLTKSVEESTFTAGTTLHYRFLITNTGNTTIEQLAVDDPLPGLSPVSCPVASLAPGASTTCTATYVATADDVARGEIVNTATVVGVPVQGGQLVSEPSTVQVAAVVPPPPPSSGPTAPSLPGELPATGGDSNQLLGVALLLTGGGLILIVGAVRRRKRIA